MKTKRFSKWSKVWAVLLAAVLAFGLSGCGAGTGSGSSGKKTKDGLKEVDVVLDWYPNAVHSFLYWAQEKGYFRKEGLKVKIISPAESVDAINFVASGKAQVGISYPIDTINAVVNKHMPVKAIGAVTQKQMVVMISLQSNSITKDFKTLKGKKIGYDGTNSGGRILCRTEAGGLRTGGCGLRSDHGADVEEGGHCGGPDDQRRSHHAAEQGIQD